MITKLYNCWYNIKGKINNEDGQGMVEYALIIGLVAVVLIGGLNALNIDIAAIFTEIGDALNPPS